MIQYPNARDGILRYLRDFVCLHCNAQATAISRLQHSASCPLYKPKRR